MSSDDNNNNDNNNDIAASSGTTASMLMQAGGQVCKVTGLTLSTTSTLYVMKYMTTAGCSLVEYLPVLFSADPNKSGFIDHMRTQNEASVLAVGGSVCVLLGGVVLRKLGTLLSSPKTIRTMERFLYRKSR